MGNFKDPTADDYDQAIAVIMGTHPMLRFSDKGSLQLVQPRGENNDNHKIDRETSQSLRGVQAALTDYFLTLNPKADNFVIEVQENLTDTMASMVETMTDMSDMPLVELMETLEWYLRTVSDDFEELAENDKQQVLEQEHKNNMRVALNIMRCREKYADEEPTLMQFRHGHPEACKFLTKNKQAIRQMVEEKREGYKMREKYDLEPADLRKGEGFWDSVRLQIAVHPPLLEEARTRIKALTAVTPENTSNPAAPTPKRA